MSLVAVGTVAFDAIETPFGKADKVVGGAATYITLAASYFVKQSHLVSVVGEDFPTDFLKGMADRGIHQEGLQIKAGEKSFFWAGKYHYDLNTRDTLATELNVLADFKPVVPEAAKNEKFLMLGNLDPSIQLSVLDQMEERPKLVVLDTMNFWMDVAMDQLAKIIARVDVLTINDEEARQLTKQHSLVKAAQMIMDMGPKYLIIKKGEHGALLFDREQVFFAPALPLEDVVDPTGAGDTFAGGFIGYLARTGNITFPNLKRAVIIGSAMASFTCEAFGPERLLHLTTEEIDARIQKFVDLVDFDILLVD